MESTKTANKVKWKEESVILALKELNNHRMKKALRNKRFLQRCYRKNSLFFVPKEIL